MDEATLRARMRPSPVRDSARATGVHDGLVTTGLSGLAGIDELAATNMLTDISAWQDGECWLKGPPLGPGWHPGPALFSSRSELLVAAGELAERAGFEGDLPSLPLAVFADANGQRTWVEQTGLRANLTVRVPYLRAFSLAELIRGNMFPPDVAEFIWRAYTSRLSLLLAGPGNAGKTTVLRALLEQSDVSERQIVMEELPELRIKRANVVSLAGRPANAENVGGRGLKELVDHSLYGSADRLVVGELRGKEADPFVRALCSGHKGGLGAIHAGSTRQALNELVGFVSEGMGPQTTERAASRVETGVDLVVVLNDDSERGVVEVAEVSPGDSVTPGDVGYGMLWERGHWLVQADVWWAER